MAATLNTVEENCPECFRQCMFCSDYVWIIRKHGCGAGSFGNGRKKLKNHCASSVAEKGKDCGTCGKPCAMECKNGGGMLLVERRILKTILA